VAVDHWQAFRPAEPRRPNECTNADSTIVIDKKGRLSPAALAATRGSRPLRRRPSWMRCPNIRRKPHLLGHSSAGRVTKDGRGLNHGLSIAVHNKGSGKVGGEVVRCGCIQGPRFIREQKRAMARSRLAFRAPRSKHAFGYSCPLITRA